VRKRGAKGDRARGEIALNLGLRIWDLRIQQVALFKSKIKN